MPKHYILQVFLFFISGFNLIAASNSMIEEGVIEVFDEVSKASLNAEVSFLELMDTTEFKEVDQKKIRRAKVKEKLICIGLCIALGPFGVHRLYLGTTEKVPILYTLTLGGGLGVLPIVDLFTILFTKDLSKYRNNSNVFLWTPPKGEPEDKKASKL